MTVLAALNNINLVPFDFIVASLHPGGDLDDNFEATVQPTDVCLSYCKQKETLSMVVQKSTDQHLKINKTLINIFVESIEKNMLKYIHTIQRSPT